MTGPQIQSLYLSTPSRVFFLMTAKKVSYLVVRMFTPILILKGSQLRKEKETYLADNVPSTSKSVLYGRWHASKAVRPFDDLCPGYNPTVTCYCSTLFVFKNELLLSSRLEDLMIDGEDLLIVMEYLLGSSNAINQYKRPIFFKVLCELHRTELKNI